MPNWVYNGMSITGQEAKVQEVKNRLAEPYETIHIVYVGEEHMSKTVTVKKDFSFWNMARPEGEDLEKYEASLKGGGGGFWYDWNITNWGTKWDVEAEFEERANDHVFYRFETAWSPPTEALISLSTAYPDVRIELEFEEEQGWGGTTVFSGGESVATDWYDIPNSHEDYESRGDRECPCEEWSDKVFDDCPIDPDTVVPRDEILREQLV